MSAPVDPLRLMRVVADPDFHNFSPEVQDRIMLRISGVLAEGWWRRQRQLGKVPAAVEHARELTRVRHG